LLMGVSSMRVIRLWTRRSFGVRPRGLESLTITSYEPAGYYKVHHDGFDRQFTFLCYINDAFEGGATTFPVLGCSITPRAGRLVAWRNSLSKGRPRNEMLHYAEPVISGRKIVVQQWTRYVGV